MQVSVIERDTQKVVKSVDVGCHSLSEIMKVQNRIDSEIDKQKYYTRVSVNVTMIIPPNRENPTKGR